VPLATPQRSMLQVEERIADMVFFWMEGRQTKVIIWLKSIGCKVERVGEQINIQGICGVNGGLCTGQDPNTVAVMFGFMIAGPYWPQAFPKLQREVNKRWDAWRKSGGVEASPPIKPVEIDGCLFDNKE
jgi:hypothetical protein